MSACQCIKPLVLSVYEGWLVYELFMGITSARLS